LGALFWGLGLGFRSGTIYEVRYLLHNSEQGEPLAGRGGNNSEQITPKKCGLFLKYAPQLEAESKQCLFQEHLEAPQAITCTSKTFVLYPPIIHTQWVSQGKQTRVRCHTVALPFTFNKILRQKKSYGDSNISPCKTINLRKNPLKETKILQDKTS
jgi:hypothetical protein